MAFLPGPPFCIFDLPLKQRLSLSSGLSSPQSRKLLKWKEEANNENHGRALVLHLVWSHWTSSKSGGTCSHWWCGTFLPQGHKTHAFPNWGSQTCTSVCHAGLENHPTIPPNNQTNKETKPWVTQRIRSGCSLASFHLSIEAPLSNDFSMWHSQEYLDANLIVEILTTSYHFADFSSRPLLHVIEVGATVLGRSGVRCGFYQVCTREVTNYQVAASSQILKWVMRYPQTHSLPSI